MGTVLPFPEDWVPQDVSPALTRFKLSGRVLLIHLSEIERHLMFCRLCFFHESIFFRGQGAVTELVKQSNPDHVPDSGH
jgi:hypothetical protein